VPKARRSGVTNQQRKLLLAPTGEGGEGASAPVTRGVLEDRIRTLLGEADVLRMDLEVRVAMQHVTCSRVLRLPHSGFVFHQALRSIGWPLARKTWLGREGWEGCCWDSCCRLFAAVHQLRLNVEGVAWAQGCAHVGVHSCSRMVTRVHPNAAWQLTNNHAHTPPL
jgi:hypothetical protein